MKSLAAVIPLALLLALFAVFVPFGQINPDEGFYMGSAKGIADGGTLYRDFGYTQMPLLPAIHSVLLRPFGFGLFQLRVANALWGLLLAGVSLYILKKHSPRSALLGGLTLVSAVVAVSCLAMAKSLAASGAFLTLAALVMVSERPHRQKLVLFALAAAAAVACRLTVGGAVVVLCVGLGLQRGRLRDLLAVFALTGAVGVLLLLPFVVAAPVNFYFWNLGYHFQSTVDRDRVAASVSLFLAAPAPTLLALAGGYFAIKRRAWRESPGWIALAAAAGFASQYVLPVAYAEYATPFIGLAVVGGWMSLPENLREAKAAWAVPALGVATLVFARPPPPDFGLPSKVDAAAKALASRTPENARVIAASAIVPVAARRAVVPPLENAPFAFTTLMSDAEAASLALTTPSLLAAELDAGRVHAVVMWNKRPLLNFGWSVPSYTPVRAQDLTPLTSRISSAKFDTIYKDDWFVVMVPRAAHD